MTGMLVESVRQRQKKISLSEQTSATTTRSEHQKGWLFIYVAARRHNSRYCLDKLWWWPWHEFSLSVGSCHGRRIRTLSQNDFLFPPATRKYHFWGIGGISGTVYTCLVLRPTPLADCCPGTSPCPLYRLAMSTPSLGIINWIDTARSRSIAGLGSYNQVSICIVR